MVERWHLVLAGWALVGGAAVAATDRWGPAWASRHAVGVAALVGAVLGSWGNARWWPWLAAAVVVAVTPDREPPVHPLGRWVVPVAVVSLVGVWSAVPDTEPPLAAACALAPIALVRTVAGRSVGRAGTAALVVAVLGSVWVGSAGWGSALTTACAVGMVVVAPSVLGFGRDAAPAGALWRLVPAHVVVALAVPRLVMERSVPVAAALSAAALTALVVVAWSTRARPLARVAP